MTYDSIFYAVSVMSDVERRMDFLRECAKRLDEGEDASSVMADLRVRYTTLRCVNVKACLVRRMCVPTTEYREACECLFSEHEGLRECLNVESGVCTDIVRYGSLVRTLPPRLPPNVRGFTITRDELRQCKRESARRAIVKNRRVERVRGRDMLRHARDVVSCVVNERCSIPELTLALILLTGRRECEILNGQSEFSLHTEYSLYFRGQAKKRGSSDDEYVIPTLAPADDIVRAMERLRHRQGGVVLGNRETSRRYQSYLSRHLSSSAVWSEAGRVHSLRGLYACMAFRLFEWEDHSQAFVAMCILGHTSLHDSLVYTPFHLGGDFSEEPTLGRGNLTPWMALEERERVGRSTPRGEGEPTCS